MYKALFTDHSLQRQFDEKGFVTLQMLDPQKVKDLLDLYNRYIRTDQVSGLYESSRNNDPEVNHLINNTLYEAFRAPCESVFLPSTLYGGTFMVKSHRDSEVLPLHQDWSIVDEEQYSTLFIWCPLMEVSSHNGGLFVLEGSHRYFNTLRSGSYPSNRYLLPPELHRFTKDISLKAGEAILYSDKLFHGSHANNSDRDRIVATARIMQAEAQLLYFHKAGEDKADAYHGTADFYLNQINRIAKGQKPLGVKKLFTRRYRHHPVTDEALQSKIKEHFMADNDFPAPDCRIFKDPALQATFETNGYAVIDLIDADKVRELRAFYDSLHNSPMPEHGFQVSLDNQNPEFVQKVTEKLINTVQPEVAAHFENHQVFTASFVVKSQNPLSVVPPHQDWTFVDELRHWSATIWCPLTDVHAGNGGLGVIRGSHRFYNHVRPSPSPQFAPPFSDQIFDIFPYLRIIELKAGQALVFNNKTIHGSPPNFSGHERIAFGIGITHRDATLRHYYLLPGREGRVIEGYEVNSDFFYRYNNASLSAMHERGESPRGLNSIGVFQFDPVKYDTAALTAMIKAAGNEPDMSLMQRMADLFRYNMDGTKKETPAVKPAVHPQDKLRHFWKVYTPRNIYLEIQYRLSKLK